MAGLQNEGNLRVADVLPVFFVLVAGAIFGGSMVVLTPPFNVPEEQQHLFRSYQCSQGIVYATRSGNAVGGEVPESFHEVNSRIIGGPRDEYSLRISLNTIKSCLAVPLDPERHVFATFPVTVRYSPVSYLPSAAALGIGRCLGLKALKEVYLGRTGTLIGYLLLVAAAVWLMPVHKWTLALVALMPMSIFLAASLSADAISSGISLLAIALILRLALGPAPISRRSLGWLGLVMLLLALAKPGYVLLSLFFFLVPKERFSDRRHCWQVRAWLVGLPLAVSIAWVLSIRGLCVPLRPNIDVNAQAHWMLANPGTYLQSLAARLFDPDLYFATIALLGWGTILLPMDLYRVYWFALLVTAVLDGGREKVRVPLSTRAGGVGVYLLVMSVITTLTYLTWHAVGESFINGVQPRYLIPVLPLLLLPLRSRAEVASSRLSRWLVPCMAIAVVMLGIGGTWKAMIVRHYWP